MSSTRVLTNACIALALLTFSSLYFWASMATLKGATDYDTVGEAGFPKALAAMLAVIGIGLLVQCAVNYRGREARSEPPADPAPVSSGIVVTGWLLLAAYLFLLPRIGFVAATIAFAISLLWLVDYRKPVPVALVAGGTTLACWAVFEKLLGVMLPAPGWF